MEKEMYGMIPVSHNKKKPRTGDKSSPLASASNMSMTAGVTVGGIGDNSMSQAATPILQTQTQAQTPQPLLQLELVGD